MKPIPSVAVATWMLEHLTFGSCDASLAGDLLEELRAGRSAGWYWRQSLSAIAVTLLSKSRAYVLPLVFSIGWSTLYPALWPSILRSEVAQNLWERMGERDWPFSTGLQFVNGVTPTVLFVWIGFFVYLTTRNRVPQRLSLFRTLVSLSVGLNVLFVATIGVHLRDHGLDVNDASQENFNTHFVALSVPLALSLFSALLCALPPMRRRHSDANSIAV
ncbi:hypothetical protein [Granulicella sp. dw_53]|uniref:hypothetical protein n=1 Tax=Granulicella sp. dw_53 TaxID=2719792 RepID=UPI001BD454CD|nr:hypothetical protein [Granulicella sp. dw_53]